VTLQTPFGESGSSQEHHAAKQRPGLSADRPAEVGDGFADLIEAEARHDIVFRQRLVEQNDFGGLLAVANPGMTFTSAGIERRRTTSRASVREVSASARSWVRCSAETVDRE
jgi:hypothetical protein